MFKCARRTLRRNILAALCCAPALLLVASPVYAGPNDILIGLDEKVTYGPDGPVNGAPGKDEVLVMDVSTPAKPVIRARLPLMNSLLGPPTNLQITPDGKLGLVANSVLNTPDAIGFTVSPDDRLFVIDLTAIPPDLVDTVTVGKQPSGLAISRKGDLALVANRYGKSVSVLSIAGGKVSVVARGSGRTGSRGGRHHAGWQARVRLPECRQSGRCADDRRAEGHLRQDDGHPGGIQSVQCRYHAEW